MVDIHIIIFPPESICTIESTEAIMEIRPKTVIILTTVSLLARSISS